MTPRRSRRGPARRPAPNDVAAERRRGRPTRSSAEVLARFRRVIARVPRGRVVTYGGVAAAVGFAGAARLTVRALRSAPLLPWHRVVAAGGRIALRGDEGEEQRLRLAVEGVTFHRGRVRMDRHAWRPRRRG